MFTTAKIIRKCNIMAFEEIDCVSQWVFILDIIECKGTKALKD